MSSSPNLNIGLGTVSGVPIVANLDGAGFRERVTVTLRADYVRAPPNDWPNANPGTGNQPNFTAFAQTIPSGTDVIVFLEEATALVAAGAATLGAVISKG
jgi:hypothetical protein